VILTLNAGSSSLKVVTFRANAEGDLRQELSAHWAGLSTGAPTFSTAGGSTKALSTPSQPAGTPPENPRAALASILAWIDREVGPLDKITATSHRIVHGGPNFSEPRVVDGTIATQLEQLKHLAPLHAPYGLAVLAEVRAQLPSIPHIACFDTAFHATQPDVATRLPLPQYLHSKGYRRYGFHGLNYEHVVAELPRITNQPLPRRLLAFHLGNGASATAINDGKSVATTMGYTPLDGLVMGTRTGTIDPGVVIALMRDENLDHDALETLLYKQSGLLALSGLSSDMRTLLASDDKNAMRAVEHFCYWAGRHAGSLVSAMQGVDSIVFTGGIGENAPAVRARIISQLSWLGVEIDNQRNNANAPQLSGPDSRITIWRIPANEELMLAKHAAALIY
jgi:acetate kinase